MLYFIAAFGALLLIGVPLITRKVHLPAVMEFKEVPPGELDDKQRLFFDEHDAALRALGFTPVTTFAVVNMQNPNLTRYYQSEFDSSVAFVTAITAAGGQSFQHYTELVQEFADGTQLTTKNTQLSSVFPPLPNRFTQELRGASPAALKAAHDRWLARERKAPAGRVRRDDLFAHITARHTEWLTALETGGYLRRDPVQPIFRATAKTALRGVANFVNPLADNFTMPRLAAGLVLGAALPLAATLFENDVLMKLVPYLPAELAQPLFFAAVYTLAGVAVGRIFTGKAFLWAFLLAVVPVGIVSGGRADHLFAEIWCAAVAQWVCGWHTRKAAIVAPPAPEAPAPTAGDDGGGGDPAAPIHP